MRSKTLRLKSERGRNRRLASHHSSSNSGPRMPDVSPVAGEQATPTQFASDGRARSWTPGCPRGRSSCRGPGSTTGTAPHQSRRVGSSAEPSRLWRICICFSYSRGSRALARLRALGVRCVSTAALIGREIKPVLDERRSRPHTQHHHHDCGSADARANANAAVASAMIGLSVVYLLNGVQTQFQVELTRSFRFTAIATTDILSQFLGLVVGISAALLGAGVLVPSCHADRRVCDATGRARDDCEMGSRRPRLDVPMRHHISSDGP